MRTKKSKPRKCFYCKEEIDVDNRDGTFFVDGTSCVHCDCFTGYKTSLKRSPWSAKKCGDYISERLLSLDTDISRRSVRLQLTDWIMKKYDISCLPSYFFTKLDSVYKGTLKNQSRPIPPAHLLDMWQQKEGYLDKVATKNAVNRKEISGISRVNYDLAIIMSRYDAYLNWKAQCEVDKKAATESAVGMMNTPQKQALPATRNRDGLDINELIDEI